MHVVTHRMRLSLVRKYIWLAPSVTTAHVEKVPFNHMTSNIALLVSTWWWSPLLFCLAKMSTLASASTGRPTANNDVMERLGLFWQDNKLEGASVALTHFATPPPRVHHWGGLRSEGLLLWDTGRRPKSATLWQCQYCKKLRSLWAKMDLTIVTEQRVLS